VRRECPQPYRSPSMKSQSGTSRTLQLGGYGASTVTRSAFRCAATLGALVVNMLPARCGATPHSWDSTFDVPTTGPTFRPRARVVVRASRYTVTVPSPPCRPPSP
jgi:hypothetical protein